MTDVPKLQEAGDATLSVLLRVLAAREAKAKQRKQARLRAYSHTIILHAYLTDLITTGEFYFYDNVIRENGYLKLSPKDDNLFLFREIARWM